MDARMYMAIFCERDLNGIPVLTTDDSSVWLDALVGPYDRDWNVAYTSFQWLDNYGNMLRKKRDLIFGKEEKVICTKSF